MWMIPQQQMKDHHAMKFMAIMAERDSAVYERNLAISEKKAALAERDMAFLQRDTAIAERNNAIAERDSAITALEYNARENGMNGNNGHGCPPGCTAPRGVRQINLHHHHLPHSPPQFADAPCGNHSRELQISEAFPAATASETVGKAKHVKRAKKDSKAQEVALPKKASKSGRKSKRAVGGENLNRLVTIAQLHQGEWNKGQDVGGGAEDLNKQQVSKHRNDDSGWKDLQELGLNQVTFDDSTMPVPVCSCTGRYQPCYKWGNGGWQSACCTTTLSMYPLPVMPNKRHNRVGGRKMSGTVFSRLLSRLAAEGHDLSTPLDLKDHWAKHGTNRYITIK